MGRIGPYHTLTELLGAAVQTADLLQALSKISRSDVLRCLAGMSTLVSRESSSTPQEQLRILRRFTPPDIAGSVERELAKRKAIGTLFFRRQLWFVWQMALIACKDDSTVEHSIETQQQVGFCCLMASEVLKGVESVYPVDPEEAKSLRFIATTLISLSDTVLGAEVIARCHMFWLELQEDEEVRSLAGSLGLKPLGEAFNAAYGVPLQEFLRFAVLLYYKFAEATLQDPPSALMFDATLAFREYFLPAQISSCLKLLSVVPDELAYRLLGTPRQTWALDTTVLLKSPLLEVMADRYVCFDLHIYRAFLVNGVFELLANVVGHDKMKQLLGRIFERYIERLMLNFSPQSDVINTPYLRNVVFAADKTQEACDGLLVWQTFAVLLECKTNMLTTRQRYAMSFSDTMKGIDEQIATFSDPNEAKSSRRKGIGQLAFNIHRILCGDEIKSAGRIVDLSSVSKFYPTVVLYDDDLVNHAVRIHLNSELIKWFDKHGFDRSRVGYTLLFSLKDIEYYEVLATSHGAEKVMREYIQFVEQHPTEVHSMFHEFALSRYPKESRSGQGYALEVTNRTLTELQAEMNHRRETGYVARSTTAV